MIQQNTLTGGRKMMNMQKLGTVSTAGNYFHSPRNPRHYRAGSLMRYTLCVIEAGKQRNGSRHSFAPNRPFDIASITGRTTPAQTSARLSGFYVIPGQTPMGRSRPANPHGYWLTARRIFQKNAKLFHPLIRQFLAKPRQYWLAAVFCKISELFRVLTLALARMGCLSGASDVSGNSLHGWSALSCQAGFDVRFRGGVGRGIRGRESRRATEQNWGCHE